MTEKMMPPTPEAVASYQFLSQPIGEALAKLNGHGVGFWSSGDPTAQPNVLVLLVAGPLAGPVGDKVKETLKLIEDAVKANEAQLSAS